MKRPRHGILTNDTLILLPLLVQNTYLKGSMNEWMNEYDQFLKALLLRNTDSKAPENMIGP